MTRRFTVKDVGVVFTQLCDVMGREQGYEHKQWSIEKWGAKYRIQEGFKSSAGKGCSLPFGHRYYTAKEFCLVVWFAVDVVDQYKRGL